MKNGYEVVKVVNGYEVYRAIGTRGFYYVDIKRWDNGCKAYRTFRTIKSAVEYIETCL